MPYDTNPTKNFATSGTNGYVSRNVETSSVSFFSGEMMLRVSFLDQTGVRIAFRPGVYNEAGQRKFPAKKEPNFTVTLRIDECIDLLDRIDSYFIPKFSALIDEAANGAGTGKTVSVGIMVKRKDNIRVLNISSGELTENGYEPVLQLHNGVNSDRIPAETLEYKFTTSFILDDYNHKNGEYKIHPTAPQLILFRRMLDNYINSVTNGFAHSMHMVYGEKFNNLNDNVSQLCVKNGVTPKSSFNNFGGFSSNNGQPNLAAAPAPQMLETSLDDMLAGAESVF